MAAIFKRLAPMDRPLLTPALLRVLVDEQGGVCRWCGRPVTTCRRAKRRGHALSASFDHLVPQAFGGTDERANLVAACRRCNETRDLMPWRAWEALVRGGMAEGRAA